MEHGRVLIGGASFSFQKSSSWKASFLCHLVPRTTPSRVTQHESPPRCSVPYTCSNRIHIWNKRMHRSRSCAKKPSERVCVNERRVEGAESRMPVFPGPRIGTGYISCDSIRSFSWSTIKSFLLPFVIVFDFSQFLKFIFERVESLKREFQFYNYGSSDVNISDFVYGGYNIVARVFVFKKLFFFWLFDDYGIGKRKFMRYKKFLERRKMKVSRLKFYYFTTITIYILNVRYKNANLEKK